MTSRSRSLFSRAFALACLSGPLLAAPTFADTVGPTGCVRTAGGNSCTANDSGIILIGLGTQDDGCVSINDTVDILLGAQIDAPTGDTRYDFGMWVDTSSVGSALDGTACFKEALHETPGTFDSNTDVCGAPPPLLNLNSGVGPFYEEDDDYCDEHTKSLDDPTCGVDPPVTMFWVGAVTGIPCADDASADGYVDLPVCATWGNSVDQVGATGGGDKDCDNAGELEPGTPSKCSCEPNIASTIPVPSLALACACVQVSSNIFDCSIRARNTRTCTPAGTGTAPNITCSNIERERCAAASFIRFKTTTNTSQVTISNTGNTNTTDDNGVGGVLTWTPTSTRGDCTSPNGGTSGVMVQGQGLTAGTITEVTYRLTVDNSVGPNDIITNTTAAYWANVNTFSPEDLQSSSALSLDCSFTRATTWARVVEPAAYRDRGRVVVEWKTSAEDGVIGFELLRFEAAAGEFVPVTERRMAAAGTLAGGTYRVVDPTLGSAVDRAVYKIVEHELSGKTTEHGPYALSIAAERGPRAALGPAVLDTTRVKAPTTRVVEAARAPEAPPVGSGAAKVRIPRDGMYQISTATLASVMGLSGNTLVSALQSQALDLREKSMPVAYETLPGNAGVVFYARGLDSNYAAERVLRASIGQGTAMAKANVGPGTVGGNLSFATSTRFEEDHQPWLGATQNPYLEHWYWLALVGGDPDYGTTTLAAPLPGALASAAGTLALDLDGYAPDAGTGAYQADVRWNGVSLGFASWDGPGGIRHTFAIPSGAVGAANELEVVAIAGTFFVDAFEVGYRRQYKADGDQLAFRGDGNPIVKVSGFSSKNVALYDVSQHLSPVRIQNVVAKAAGGSYAIQFRPASPTTRYLAIASNAIPSAAVVGDELSDLRSPGNGAEYLVIAPATLAAGAQELADYRGAASNLSTQVAKLEDVLDEFGQRHFDPQVIREFLAYTQTHWSPQPKYVALVGRGSIDYKNVLGLGGNAMPPALAPAFLGLVPSDFAYGDFDDDGVSELAIGRIPAASNGEISAFVAKLAAYESAAAGAWASEMIVVADNPDDGGDFTADAESIVGRAPAGIAAKRIYVGAPYSGAEARENLLAALEHGAKFFFYAGHAGLDTLASEGLLSSADAPGLANAPRLPVFASQTCYVGHFAFPGYSSLAEEMLMAPGGAIASWGPAAQSVDADVQALGEALTDEILAGAGTVGDRVRAAMAAYVDGGGPRGLAAIYTLLGDPATEIK